jgi:hypothetical protein
MRFAPWPQAARTSPDGSPKAVNSESGRWTPLLSSGWSLRVRSPPSGGRSWTTASASESWPSPARTPSSPRRSRRGQLVSGGGSSQTRIRSRTRWCRARTQVEFAERFVAEAPDLDVTGNTSDQGPISLRELLVHMVEEYARHNGHADLLRERIDGRVGQ